MRAGPVLLLVALPLVAPLVAAADVPSLLGNGVFEPERLEVAPGDRIVWTNGDDRAHTVTSSWDGGATFDVLLRPGETFAWVVPAEGEWPVHCVPHATLGPSGGYDGMVQTVVASAPAAGAEEGSAPNAGLLVSVLAAAGLVAGGALLRARRRPQ